MRREGLGCLGTPVGRGEGELRPDDARAVRIVATIHDDPPLPLRVAEGLLRALHQAHGFELHSIGLGMNRVNRAFGECVERDRERGETRECRGGGAGQAHRMRLPPESSMSISRTSTAVEVMTNSVGRTPWRSIQLAISPGST